MPSNDVGARTRFTKAWVTGASVATIAYSWMVSEGRADLFRFRRLNSDFYDAQARALLHGKLAIPARTLNIEGFRHDGKTFTYFPPFPALLRVPVIAVTDSLDGRLTALSMVLAFLLGIVAAGVLTWRVRQLVRAEQPVGRIELVVTALFAALVGVGSQLYFTASRAWVYNESAAWGMALAVCAFDQVVAFVRAPTAARLVRSSLFAGAAVLSRAPTGAGALAALGLVFAIAVVGTFWPGARRGLAWTGVPGTLFERRGWLGGLAVAAVAPVVVYAAINHAKFGTLFSVPYDAQAQNLIDAHRRRVLAANHDSLFTLKAIPTQLWQYLRPDAVRMSSTFPWVGAPTAKPAVLGDLLFDRRDHTVSVTAGMPLLVGLAIVGVVAIVRTRAVAALRVAAIGALVVLPVSLSFLYIAQRYASDLFPLLLLLSAAGLPATISWLERRTVPWRRALTVAFVVLVVVGCWTGVAVALENQRNLASLVPIDLRREYVGWQWDVADTLGFGAPEVERGAHLPAPSARNSLFVVGPCNALYVSDGDEWHAVERANRGGHLRVQVGRRALRSGPVTLARAGSGTDEWTVELVGRGHGRAVLVEPTRGVRSTSFALDRGDVFDIVFDRNEGWLTVARGDRELWATPYDGPERDFASGNEVRTLTVPTSVCRRVRDSLS